MLPGNNEGANPVEFLLHARAGCVTTALVLHAAARGIRIDQLSSELGGEIDPGGLLGLDESVSPGYQQPPATAPMTKKVSEPVATASGSGASGDSWDRSCSQAKNRTNGRRCPVK